MTITHHALIKKQSWFVEFATKASLCVVASTLEEAADVARQVNKEDGQDRGDVVKVEACGDVWERAA